MDGPIHRVACIYTLPIIAFLICSAGICSSQTTTVRLVDFRNGRPLRDRRVTIRMGVVPEAPTVEVKTDQAGVANFTLPSPPPAELSISTPELWSCAAGWAISSEELARSGVVQLHGCKLRKSLAHIEAVPGVAIIYARPIPWWGPIWGHLLGS